MAALLFLSGAFWLLLLLEPTLAGAEDIIRPPGIPGIGYLAYGDSGADGHNDADVNGHPGSDPGWILIDSTWWLPATDKIVTQNAQGIYCEIFGGNGGNGGYNHLMNASGGNGGDGGGGGALFITNYGGIATSGIPGQGIYGRSYGGAGGNAGTGYGYPGIGGNGGAGGNGGPVTIDNQGAITTNGGQAHGIFAVSQAGGGGSGGYGHWGTGIGGNGGNGGNAGPVTIANQGAITTNGDQAHGIFAVSQAGEGGSGGYGAAMVGHPGGTGYGSVNVLVAGNILCSGAGSNGIQAQSLGRAQKGKIAIDVTVNSGTVQGGFGGTGVVFMDGHTNRLTNHGAITTLDGINGLAIQSIASGTPGNLTIENYGTITGSVNLAGSVYNYFNNEPGATFNAGPMVNLGGGPFNNYGGTFHPYGSGKVGTVNLTGNFSSVWGSIYLEVAAADRYDRLDINGTAGFFNGGTIEFDFIDGYKPLKGNSWDFLFFDSITGWDLLSFTLEGLGSGYEWDIQLFSDHATLLITGVPLPNTLVLLGPSLGLLFWGRRKLTGKN